jgi:hypothetical protein
VTSALGGTEGFQKAEQNWRVHVVLVVEVEEEEEEKR